MKITISILSWFLTLLPAVAQTTLTPPAPAISPGPISPALGQADFTNGTAITGFSPGNQPVTSVQVSDVAPLLTNLESSIAAVLPSLAAFNDSFDFVGVSNGVTAPGATITSNALATPGAAVPGSSPAFVLPPGLNGMGTTNGTGTVVLSRDTLRALLIAQNDLERLLPILDAINGGTNFIVIVSTNR